MDGRGDDAVSAAMAAPAVDVPDFGARTDGPWPRTDAELARTWLCVTQAAAAVLSDAPVSDGRQADDEAYVLGVFFAARWAFGLSPVAPVTGRSGSLDGSAIQVEVTAATRVVIDQGPEWQHAAGVRALLLWLTGVRSDLRLGAV
jgi:hypothetical protein